MVGDELATREKKSLTGKTNCIGTTFLIRQVFVEATEDSISEYL